MASALPTNCETHLKIADSMESQAHHLGRVLPLSTQGFQLQFRWQQPTRQEAFGLEILSGWPIAGHFLYLFASLSLNFANMSLCTICLWES
jgi:hypothetical protein